MRIALLSGSVYGSAEEVARHIEKILQAADHKVQHNPRVTLAQLQEFSPEAFLAVTSTTFSEVNVSMPRSLRTAAVPSAM